MKYSVPALARAIQARLIGGSDTELTGVASVRSAKPGDLVFVEDEKFLPVALNSAATAVIAGESAAKVNSEKALLICALLLQMAYRRRAARQPRLAACVRCRETSRNAAVHGARATGVATSDQFARRSRYQTCA